ncbi:MAG: aminoglycoside phosphotransferase family protein [Lachnospiraceae bacterium]|nr:aminoglycoside phosphotransferase family protein [Lachnospiraceae bacterium]
MESKTKSTVSREMIAAVVSRHFPGEELLSIEELTEGMFNSAYVIRGSGIMESGIVLKVGPAPEAELLTYEKDILRTEVEAYRLLQGRPIRIPRILAWDYTHEEIPCDYFFMEHVEGCLWKNCAERISPENRRQLMYELGRCNAAVHGVKGNWFGYLKEDARFRFDTWAEAFFAMMSDILEDGRRKGCRLPYDEITAAVIRRKDCLNAVRTPCLVDFDMWAGNVLVDEASCSRITGIIDFERCFFGDPAADFISAVSLFDNVEEEPDFRRGYSQVSQVPFEVTEDMRIRMDLYRLYMAVILFVESYRFGETYESKVKTQMAERIGRLLKQDTK